MLEFINIIIISLLSFNLVSIYATKIKIPLLGTQHIILNISENKSADLILNGLVNVNGKTSFIMDENEDLCFSYDNTIENIIKKHKCTIKLYY